MGRSILHMPTSQATKIDREKPSEEYLKMIREGLMRGWGNECVSTGLYDEAGIS